MGRYYNGDIEGKFMFGVQCSTSGERFGAQEVEPTWIDYEVDREDFEILFNDQMKELNENGSVSKCKEFFEWVEKENNNLYNTKDQEKFGITHENLSDYADYELGMQIKDWFDNNKDRDTLCFSAEL